MFHIPDQGNPVGCLQVNAAVDDAAVMAEDMARLLSAAKSKAKLSTAERKRAQALMISIAVSAPSRLCCVGHARECAFLPNSPAKLRMLPFSPAFCRS